MDDVRFAVDTAVWLDGVTFAAAKPASETVVQTQTEQPTFKETLAKTETSAALDEVKDLTPLVVGKDAASSAPGTRLDGELKRTTFQTVPLKRSPHNMSEARAKRREEALAQKELKGVKDEKLFPMNAAARYRGNGSGVAAQTVLQKPVSLPPPTSTRLRRRRERRTAIRAILCRARATNKLPPPRRGFPKR